MMNILDPKYGRKYLKKIFKDVELRDYNKINITRHTIHRGIHLICYDNYYNCSIIYIENVITFKLSNEVESLIFVSFNASELSNEYFEYFIKIIEDMMIVRKNQKVLLNNFNNKEIPVDFIREKRISQLI